MFGLFTKLKVGLDQKQEFNENLIHRIKPFKLSETTSYCAHFLPGALRKVLEYTTRDPVGGYDRAGDILHQTEDQTLNKNTKSYKCSPDKPEHSKRLGNTPYCTQFLSRSLTTVLGPTSPDPMGRSAQVHDNPSRIR